MASTSRSCTGAGARCSARRPFAVTASALNLDAEQRRERVLGAHIALPFGGNRRKQEQQVRTPVDSI